MNPTGEHVVRNNAQLTDVPTELIFSDACPGSSSGVGRIVPLARCPIGSQVRDCREKTAVAQTTGISNSFVTRAMNFQPGGVVSAW